MLTHAGETLTQAEWAKRANVSSARLSQRLKKMSLADALAIPPREPRYGRKKHTESTSKPPAETTPMADSPKTEEAPVQRAVDLPRGPTKASPLQPGARVRVYHKRRTTMFLTDCKLGPHEEREILASDYAKPAIAAHLVKVG